MINLENVNDKYDSNPKIQVSLKSTAKVYSQEKEVCKVKVWRQTGAGKSDTIFYAARVDYVGCFKFFFKGHGLYVLVV